MPFCGMPSYSAATSSAGVDPVRDAGGTGLSSSAPLLDTMTAPTTTTAASTVTRASWRLRAMGGDEGSDPQPSTNPKTRGQTPSLWLKRSLGLP